MSTVTRGNGKADTVYVWDPVVRLFHWTLVCAFTVAFLTEEDTMELHAWAGYVVGALVVLRVIWGFVGPERARFADFVTGPMTATRYVFDLLLLRSKRHLGHSPGGGAMVVVLLICLAVTVGLGLALYGAQWHAGPIAGWYGPAPVGGGETHNAFTRSIRGLHEFFANFTFALVCVHVAAVVFASFSHHENLVRAMITGFKRK
jgi:cytochrome b